MATGDTLHIWPAAAHEPLATSNAYLLVQANFHPFLRFDGDVEGVFSGIVPQNYDGGGYDVIIHWFSSATGNDVDWEAQFERIGVGQQDLDADGYAAIQNAIDQTEPGTVGHVKTSTIAFTVVQADSLARGEGFRLKILRDDTTDTSSGEARLRWVELREA